MAEILCCCFCTAGQATFSRLSSRPTRRTRRTSFSCNGTSAAPGGRSRRTARPASRCERLVADGIDLAEQLRKRFPEQKLIVFGHSWGSIVATEMAQRRPELFDAYVGTGQVASWAGAVQFQFDFLKRRYKEEGDADGTGRSRSHWQAGPEEPGAILQLLAADPPELESVGYCLARRVAKVAVANGETEATLKAIGDGMNASGAALDRQIASRGSFRHGAPLQDSLLCHPGPARSFSPTVLAEAYFSKSQLRGSA